MAKKGFGAIGENLSIIYRDNSNNIHTDVDWDTIVWSDVKEIGLKSNSHVVGFHKDLGAIVWYPLKPVLFDKPMFYIFQRAWGKISDTWHQFYITDSGITRTPYHTPRDDILPDERIMGYTATVNYGGNDFPIDVGVRGQPLGIPHAMVTKITTPIALQDMGIEYQFYLNPEWSSDASRYIKWVRVCTSYDPENPENNVYADYDIGSVLGNQYSNMDFYEVSFLNQDKSNTLGYFNFTDVFEDSTNQFASIEEVTLPNSETTYVMKIGATFGSKNPSEYIEI